MDFMGALFKGLLGIVAINQTDNLEFDNAKLKLEAELPQVTETDINSFSLNDLEAKIREFIHRGILSGIYINKVIQVYKEKKLGWHSENLLEVSPLLSNLDVYHFLAFPQEDVSCGYCAISNALAIDMILDKIQLPSDLGLFNPELVRKKSIKIMKRSNANLISNTNGIAYASPKELDFFVCSMGINKQTIFNTDNFSEQDELTEAFKNKIYFIQYQNTTFVELCCKELPEDEEIEASRKFLADLLHVSEKQTFIEGYINEFVNLVIDPLDSKKEISPIIDKEFLSQLLPPISENEFNKILNYLSKRLINKDILLEIRELIQFKQLVSEGFSVNQLLTLVNINWTLTVLSMNKVATKIPKLSNWTDNYFKTLLNKIESEESCTTLHFLYLLENHWILISVVRIFNQKFIIVQDSMNELIETPSILMHLIKEENFKVNYNAVQELVKINSLGNVNNSLRAILGILYIREKFFEQD